MSKKSKSDKSGMLIFIFILVLSMVLIARLIAIYISEGVINTNYRDPEINTEYFRGSIYDRSGNILAMDRTSYLIEIDAERVSEVSRLSSLISPYTDLDPVTLENEIRSNTHLSLPSNLLMAEAERFSDMLKKEKFDHIVSVKEKKERIYPLNEHGYLIIGRENEESPIAAEAVYDEILTPRLTLSEMISTGEDITLSLSQRIEYIADHIVSSYNAKEGQEYLMLALIDYSTGEIYALSQNTTDYENIDFNAIDAALSSRPYTILKVSNKASIETPEDISTMKEERYINIIYRSGFAIISSSTDKNMADGALYEFAAMLSL